MQLNLPQINDEQLHAIVQYTSVCEVDSAHLIRALQKLRSLNHEINLLQDPSRSVLKTSCVIGLLDDMLCAHIVLQLRKEGWLDQNNQLNLQEMARSCCVLAN